MQTLFGALTERHMTDKIEKRLGRRQPCCPASPSAAKIEEGIICGAASLLVREKGCFALCARALVRARVQATAAAADLARALNS